VFDGNLCRDYFKALRGEICCIRIEGMTSVAYMWRGDTTILIEEIEETLDY